MSPQAAKSLTNEMEVTSLFEVVLREVHELLECDRATLFLVDTATQMLWSKARLAASPPRRHHIAATHPPSRPRRIADASSPPPPLRRVPAPAPAAARSRRGPPRPGILCG